MLNRVVLTAILAGAALPAHALTLEGLRVRATLIQGSSKDPFRIHGRLRGGDARGMVQGFATVRFGDLTAQAPAGSFKRNGSTYSWRSYLYGVKKVSINVKKGTIDIVGGGVDLGDMNGPVRLAVATAKGVVCGTFDWNQAQVTSAAKSGRRVVRKTATGPLTSCFEEDDGEDHQAPSVIITTPTPLAGMASTLDTIALGGEVSDDGTVADLTWATDQGAGGSLVPGATFSVPAIALAAGDNRITVTATDDAGNVGTDVLDVTYNTNGIAFEGMPAASPEALFVGESNSVTVRQKILANPDLDPATIEVVQVADDATTTDVVPLEDKGNRKTGDDLSGDDVYSGLMGVKAGDGTAGPQHYRVRARTKSTPDLVAWSPVLTIFRVDPVKPDALQAAITLSNNARTLFAGLTEDGADATDAIAEVELLAKANGALAAGVSSGGLAAWWVTEDGLLGGLLGYDQTTRRGGAAPVSAPSRPTAPKLPYSIANTTTPSPISSWTEVGSRRSLVLAPYFSDQEASDVDGMLRGSQCPSYEVETYVGEDATADRFKALEEYGLILIASHGDSLFDAVGDAYRPEWSWKSAGGQAVVLTATKLSNVNLRSWQLDLRLGRMAVFPDGVAGVLPTFFTQYSVRLPSSIVYVGSCRSSADMSLASALLDRGAGAYLGYDGYVDSAFAGQTGAALFTKLLGGQTLAQAFLPATQADGGATFALAGDDAMSLATGPIVNGGFEVQSGFLASVAGFTVQGDGRIVGNLGATLPKVGTRMALASTGLGLTTQAGSFSQSVCLPPLPPGATKMTLEYDWKFYSEEFLEFCGKEFQDYFRVTFGDTQLQNTTIDDLCYDPKITLTSADVSFDKGGVYMTDWLHSSIDITPLAGSTATLTFGAGDVGDSAWDTVVLVDGVRVATQ